MLNDIDDLFKNIDVEKFLDDILDHVDSIRNGTIKVAGGVDAAKEILNNRPDNCNAYDIMYKKYGHISSWFMIDHNLTINLDDLEKALKGVDEL